MCDGSCGGLEQWEHDQVVADLGEGVDLEVEDDYPALNWLSSVQGWIMVLFSAL